VVTAYLGVSILHAAFDIFGGIPGYIVISAIGLVPLLYLWWRSGREAALTRGAQPPPEEAPAAPTRAVS
jgi:hypothetical protein